MAPIDWASVGNLATKEATEHEELKVKIVVRVGNAIGRRFDLNPDDPIVNLVQVVLGLRRDADVAEALTRAGFSVAKPEEEDGPKALPAGKPRPLPLFDENGQPEGTALPQDKGFELGYHAKLDDKGTVTGLIKPKAPIVGPAATAASQDREVEVRNGKGHVVRKVKVSDGREDASLEPKLAANGLVEYFEEKPRFVRRRS